MKTHAKPSLSRKTIALFWHHASRYPAALACLLILVPTTIVISDFVVPYITSKVLLKVSQGDFDSHAIWASFGPQVTWYIIAVLASSIIGWRIIIWLIWHLELRVTRDVAQRVFEHLMRMSSTFHANRFGGSLVSQANKLTAAYIRFADSMVFNLLPLVVAIIAAVVVLAPRVPLYALAMVVLSLIYIAGAFKFSRPVREANIRESEAQSQQTGFLADSISNIMAIKAFAAARQENNGYLKAAEHSRQMGIVSVRTVTVREAFGSLVTSGISIAAILIAILAVSRFNIAIDTVFLMVTYTGSIGQRLWDFQNVLRQYNRSMGDASDMVKILDIEPDVKDPAEPQASRIHAGTIDFKQVTFCHDNRRKKDALFKDLALHIKPGEKVGLIGHSGSGKTTLTKLLLRFNDIDSGSISIDGQDITAITQDDLRHSISYVPQEPLLFHRSIRENIAYGRPGASQKEVAAIARQANAAEFIEGLPEGYDTPVGERGVKLSGGQRQRIAIARAMIKNAPILVLDEATSALDSESESLIQDALWKLMEGRTAIVIAHRLSTIQKMDRIVVMEKGRIVEQGSHKELIRLKGTYAKMWARQSGGFIED